MNDDVNPWMIEAANEIGVETRCSDCFCDPHETAAIIARHAPKVDVEAMAGEIAMALYFEGYVEIGFREGSKRIITDELEMALNHGK